MESKDAQTTRAFAGRAVAKLAPLLPRLQASEKDNRNKLLPKSCVNQLKAAAAAVAALHTEAVALLSDSSTRPLFDLARLQVEVAQATSAHTAWEQLATAVRSR